VSAHLRVLTCNTWDAAGPTAAALADRCLLFQFPPQTARDKLEVGARILLPRLLAEFQLGGSVWSAAALQEVLRECPAAPGMRGFVRALRRAVLRLNSLVLQGEAAADCRVDVAGADPGAVDVALLIVPEAKKPGAPPGMYL